MSTKQEDHVIIEPCTTVLSADPHKKGDNNVDQQKIREHPQVCVNLLSGVE